MIGLSILLAAIAYIFLARFVSKGIENRVAKYLVISLFVLVPTWDVVPSKIYFSHLCETQAGLKIYKTVEGVEGYRVESLASGLGREALTKYGYRYEERGSGSEFARYTLDADGKVIEEKITESMARYAVFGKLIPLNWNVTKSEIVVVDQQANERLAVSTGFHAGGNWVVQAVFGDAPTGAGHCGPPEKDLYLKTLKPAKTARLQDRR